LGLIDLVNTHSGASVGSSYSEFLDEESVRDKLDLRWQRYFTVDGIVKNCVLGEFRPVSAQLKLLQRVDVGAESEGEQAKILKADL